MNPDPQLLSVLTRAGVLLNVQVRYWRGCKKLKAEDLGLRADQVSDRLISLGHKRLLPKDALSELALIEGRAHALVEQNTFPFLNGLGHFLPNAKLEEVTQRLKGLENEFWQAKERFLDRYGLLRLNAAEEWRGVARKLTANVETLVAAIEASFPLPKNMHPHFGFHTTLFQVALPEALGMELLELGDQQAVMSARNNAAREAGQRLRQQTEAFVGECVATLREQTATLCEEMLQSIRTSETGVHQKTLNRLVRFIDQFKAMNFAGDQVLEAQLETVRRELLSKTAEEYRDSRSARARLTQGLGQLAEQARALVQADTTEIRQRFGALGQRRFSLAA
jgi:hypothetical protein